MPSIAPPLFEWHDLPSTPYTGDRVFAIFTPKSELNENYPVPAVGLGQTELTWQTSPDYVRSVQSIKSELRGYVLRMHQKAGDGRLWFYGRELSETERTTPYLIETERRDVFWPTVLLKLWIEETTDANDVISYRDHSKYRDGNTYPTTIRIKHYLTDVQWGKGRFTRVYPLTGSIRANYPSLQVSFPECLHPDVNFPAIQNEPTRKVVFGAGTADTEVGSDFVKEHFPATPMTDWSKYVAEIVKSQTMGHYAYTVTEMLPPIDDREETA